MSKMYLEPCPFCGAELEDNWYTAHEFDYDKGQWVLSHNCPHPIGDLNVTINIYGYSKEDVFRRWNTRFKKES